MSCAKHSRLYCKECFPLLSVDEPQAEMQQKGEKMPTFEGQASGCREIELVRLVLSAHQTAYARFHCEEGRGVIESDNMAIGYASVELAKALQSVPSSLPKHYILFASEEDAQRAATILAKHTMGPPVTEREIESLAAAPSDAGQPALEKLRELVSHFEVKAIYYAELLKETGNLNFAGKQNAYEHAAEAVKIKLTELSPPPRTCQEEQD